MSQTKCLSALSKDTSNAMFNPLGTIISNFRLNSFHFDNAIKISPKTLIPYFTQVLVKGLSFDTLMIPQSDGTFVARAETNNFCANGQGSTEEEALEDIKEAVEILLEETDNPSGDVPWPNDYL